MQTFPSREKPALPNNILSLSQLRTMPLQEQVKALLINGKFFFLLYVHKILSCEDEDTKII